jgi:hypothetical protein
MALATAWFDTMPIKISNLLKTPAWKGGTIVQLKRPPRASVHDIMVNKWFLKGILMQPACQAVVPSSYFLADAFLAFHRLCGCRLFQVNPLLMNTQTALKRDAVKEACTLKLLMQVLRRRFRESPGSAHAGMAELKGMLRKSTKPADEAPDGCAAGVQEGGEEEIPKETCLGCNVWCSRLAGGRASAWLGLCQCTSASLHGPPFNDDVCAVAPGVRSRGGAL